MAMMEETNRLKGARAGHGESGGRNHPTNATASHAWVPDRASRPVLLEQSRGEEVRWATGDPDPLEPLRPFKSLVALR